MIPASDGVSRAQCRRLAGLTGTATVLLLATGWMVLPARLCAGEAPRHAPAPSAGASHAQGPPSSKSADADDDAGLMEFLGGIGSASDGWMDYLAQSDPTKVGAAPKRSGAEDGGSRDPGPTMGRRTK